MNFEDILRNIVADIVQRHDAAMVAEIAAAMATEIEVMAQDRVADLREQIERGDEP